ncbi:tyrosinase family protein [Nitrosovibrio sp. Nv4]|uniref:tyrosinase family protein n=1 Tax=Nitrosovibrio sp. Nv4 TaxID=1945880 RepID=UPI000BD5735B|nr:tyrosinase family protein [Nitrosovibrio sp. Nv4]SOD41999.1 Common central domain of tyrosinase [Nitrosovibrio sp. Nv4]
MAANNTVPNPTWYGDIRNMFNTTDIAHMRSQGLDLSDYSAVKNNAPGIYGQVSSGNMPRPPSAPWSAGWVQTFLNWMTNDYPKGTNILSQPKLTGLTSLTSNISKATRIRKEITTLSSTELSNLKKAFSGIMAKDIDDPNSYFAQAGVHGRPNPYCMHHIPGYNPWHRAYLVGFENALRSVPGCENVTLPYWDISTPLPDIFNQVPFASYTLPVDIGGGYRKGYVTTRYNASDIQANFVSYGVLDDFTRASTKTDWEDYTGLIDNRPNNTTIAGHDGGHVSIGDTMSLQDVAAFDPVFWFYHCNLDRLFWQWQTAMQATNLNGLLSTVESAQSRQIFTIPALTNLPPLTEKPPKLNTVEIIDSINGLDVGYEIKPPSMALSMQVKTKGSTLASEKFFVHTDFVNIRVKGINRLKIPGSFKVHLLKDGKTIASKAFFQPVEVEKCANCVENAVVHFDFELPLDSVSRGKLGVWVEPLDQSLFGDHFPHKAMGNPTVNVRLLLSNE